MGRLLFALLMLVAISGCSKKEEEPSSSVPPPLRSTSVGSPSRYLGYQHSIHIDVADNKIAKVYEASQAACREAVADLCTVLESRIRTGRAASASLKFRTKPSGIQKLIAALGKQAEITDQSTSAEDLASPIEDTAKKHAMLIDYQAKLETLRGRANADVDALIKVNRELAQVQGELEAVAGKHAHLMQRVETEILNVTISSDRNHSFFKPVSLAMSDFGSNLSEGVSIAVTGVAYLIPWALILAMFSWVGRKLWRRRKKSRADA